LQQPRHITNQQRFRPKLYQWRVLLIAHKLLDINPVHFRTRKPVAIYLQYRLGEQTTRFQLTKQSYPIRYVEEKVVSRVPFKQKMQGDKRALYIVTDTQPNTVKNGEELVEEGENGIYMDEDGNLV
jgi:hypothetical protein